MFWLKSEFLALICLLLLWELWSKSFCLLLSLLLMASLTTLMGLFSLSFRVVKFKGLKLMIPLNGLELLDSFGLFNVLWSPSYSFSNLEVGVDSRLNFALCPSHFIRDNAFHDAQSGVSC